MLEDLEVFEVASEVENKVQSLASKKNGAGLVKAFYDRLNRDAKAERAKRVRDAERAR